MLQYRGMKTTNNTPAGLTAGGANNRYSKSSPCFGNNGLVGRSAPLPTVVGPLVSCATNQLSSSRVNATSSANNVSSGQIGAFHSASKAMSSAPLVIGGGSQSSSSAIQSLGSVEEIFASAGWASKAGAIIFAAAAAGSLFLSPIDRLRGSSGGGGGGGGGGDPNPGGGSGGGGKLEHKFDSPGNKEEEDKRAKLDVDVTTAPRPYEVS